MKKWLLPIGSVTAIAVAVVAVLAVVGVFDGDDADSAEVPNAAGICAEGHPDCVDTIVDGDAADEDEGAGEDAGLEQTCLAGTEDCNDADLGGDSGEEEGTSIAPVCAPGFPDCVDKVVVTEGDSPDLGE
jgi:hypothetical protein